MKTEISRFCENYLRTVSTLPVVLKTVAETIDTPERDQLLDGPLATLNDIRARLRSLVEKIESQQAYLLIFGPLKSGKSTLMNAISGSYVSEVTSLPGYPCLVYVRHAEEPRFSVTRYNGRESVFADGHVLKEVIADSHIALAEQIRRTEEAGTEFDPRTNFSEAIRRADVNIPVQSLAESGTVLVDTPGLYSRMKFGYDVLAREFRASASCAVFVVKTDNLFLEQVFAEFNQLLGLFSRIFLVINVDSQKRDLQADGSLRPSAESQHPEQIIEAFKTLSMAGPLRQAYKDGRLRMHAVDLLSAASSFLARNGSGTADPERQQFNAFLSDLTDYLNSSDYTQEFIRDSLRQGESLCLEARGVCDGETITQLATAQEQLAAEMQQLDERIAAVDRLLAANWDETFAKAGTENATLIGEKTAEASTGLVTEMRGALDRWTASDESLRALADARWNPLLTGAGRTLAVETRCRLHRLLGTPLGGAEPAAATMSDIHLAGLKLTAVAETARLSLDEPVDETPYLTAIEQEDVPVRKSFMDWMLFRRIQTVRRRLFGEDSAQSIPADIKVKRLPVAARAAFLDLIDTAVAGKFPKLPASYSESLLAGYVARFRTGVLEQLRALREELINQRAARQAPFEASQRILAAIHELKEHAAKVLTEIDTMTQQETRRPLSQSPSPLADPDALAAPAALEYSAA
jgi:GTPase SAR1 family protein